MQERYNCGRGRNCPAVTSSKLKAKRVALPEKLVGKENPDAAFIPKAPIPEVPGPIGKLPEPLFIVRCRPRPIDPLLGSWTIKALVTGEPQREIQIRKDATIFEILAMTFEGVTLSEEERIKVVVKPLALKDGAVYRVERVSTIAKLELGIMIWDGSTARCGIEAPFKATMPEIVREAQKRIEEPLEDAKDYGMYHNGYATAPPSTQKVYELRPEVDISGSIVVKCRGADMTVQVPILQPNRWQ
jgi:hypothetical protein